MGFFEWLQTTAVAHWVQVTLIGYPLVITVHALGMGIIAGFSWIICVRLLGGFKFIPLNSMKPLFWIAWFGFIINALSGGALFTSQAATNYIHNVPYLIKMGFVLVGAISVGYLHTAVAHRIDAQRKINPGSNDTGDGAGDDIILPRSVRIVAGGLMLVWLGAIISGRLIAYLG